MTDTKTVRASVVLGGQTIDDVIVLNPGGWFGKVHLFEIGGSYAPYYVLVEGDSIHDALD